MCFQGGCITFCTRIILELSFCSLRVVFVCVHGAMSQHPEGRKHKRPRDPDSNGRGADAASSGTDEEEPEGEDLFDEQYVVRNYVVADDEEEVDDDHDNAQDEGFVDDESVSEISDHGRMEVNALLDRRHRVERELGEESEEHSSRGMSPHSDVVDELVNEEAAPTPDRAPSEHGSEAVAAPADAMDAIYNQGEMLEDVTFDWKQPHGEVADWLNQEATRRVVKNRIYNFLLNFSIAGRRVYVDKVHVMARENLQSIEVSYLQLCEVYDSVLAIWLAEVPDTMLSLLDEAANYLVYHNLYPNYVRVHKQVHVRICDLPVCDPIRDFRQIHTGVLVRVEGVVTRRSSVYPQLQAVKYDCVRCSFLIGPIIQRGNREVKISQCPSCQSKGPFRVNTAHTQFRNYQTIVLQEPPGKVPPGRLPRSLEVVLTNDIIDAAKPGEEVDITGVYQNSFDPTLNHRQGFPVFTTILHANNVSKKAGDARTWRLPEDVKEKIIALSKHPSIKKKLVQSMAPSIHGRDDIKLGLLLTLLGGVPKDVRGDQSHRIRGDINVLLVGDPGTAKSQFLKFVEKTADRAVFTTGRGSTAVGLTAAVHKDVITGDFTLEGGALVIADRGVCLIDEFDKMSDQDRTSIHEAMEQQTISVARGGIVTTLSARCSIIAAANPIGGRYDPSISFDANVDLTSPILSRFDLLFVVRDEVDPQADLKLAEFIGYSHQRSHPIERERQNDAVKQKQVELVQVSRELQEATDPSQVAALEERLKVLRADLTGGQAMIQEDDDPSSSRPLPQSTLRSYLLYAKSHCTPRISQVDEHTIARLYSELRQESKHGGDSHRRAARRVHLAAFRGARPPPPPRFRP